MSNISKHSLQFDEQHFAVVQRLAQVGSWELDLTTDTLKWSDEVFRLFEINPGEFGASYEVFLALIHPEDRAAVDRAYTGSLESRTPYSVEHRLLFGDGRIKYVVERGETCYGADGTPLRTIGIVQDITERMLANEALQRSEHLLRSVIDATPDWIFIKDREHRYRLANKGYADALQIRPEDFIGKNDLDLGFPEELVKGNPEKGIRGFWADDRLVLDSDETQVFADDLATIDGVVHTFHTIKAPLREADGRRTGILAFARDITEYKQTQTALANSMKESRDLLRALVANQIDDHESMRHAIAHKMHEDVAQSLAAANLHLAAIKGDPRHTETAAALTRAIEHITYRIREMVAKLRPNALNLGIGPGLDWLAHDFERGVGLHFILDIQDDADIGDELTTFLFRAAQELLVNVALHATATEVRLSFAADNAQYRLAISDNGRGFVFDAPHRPDAFGLIHLNEQAIRHGGQLHIDTAPGQGTRVELSLPVPSSQRQLFKE